jgi:hypothetical protein
MSRPARSGHAIPHDFDADALIFGRAQWTETELEAMDQSFRTQLQAAIEAGVERCAVGVSTVPGTKRPVSNYQRPDTDDQL